MRDAVAENSKRQERSIHESVFFYASGRKFVIVVEDAAISFDAVYMGCFAV